MQHQSTPTVTSPAGAIVPASCDQQTDLDLLPACIEAYHVATGGTVALDTITQVVEAMRDASAIVALYMDAKGEVAARVLWPSAVSVTKDKHLTTRCYCTLRREWRSFRLDRMVSVHPLTTPDDAEPEERQSAPENPARIAVRIGRALVTLSHNAHLDATDTALIADAIDDARRLYVAVAAA